jgi:hypothetical protein
MSMPGAGGSGTLDNANYTETGLTDYFGMEYVGNLYIGSNF